MTVEQPKITLSLSRTGGQGTRGDQGFIGDSVTNAEVVDGELIVTITDYNGVERVVNAGDVANSTSEVSPDWLVSSLDNDFIAAYNGTPLMKLNVDGNLDVVGDINANSTITLTNFNDSYIVIGDIIIVEADNQSLGFFVDGSYVMELDIDGNLYVAGNINSKANL